MKSLIIFGDSISTTTHGEGGYVGLINEAHHFDHVQSCAISASGLTSLTPNHLQLQIDNHNHDIRRASHVLIWHGTNDFYYHVPLQEFKDQLMSTYLSIKKINPSLQFLYLTPILRYQALEDEHQAINGFQSVNREGYTLIDIEKTIVAFTESMNLSVLIMRTSTPFHMDKIDHYYEDRVHPNKHGYHEIIKPIMNHYRI